MKNELDTQKHFWDRQIDAFDAIYSGEKSRAGRLLDQVFRRDMYQRFEYTLRHAEPIRGRRFLDVGCGTGRYAVELATRGAASVTGIDVASSMVHASRRSAAAAGVEDRTAFHEGDLFAFTPEAPVDVVIGIGLFDYVRDPLPLLARMGELAQNRVIVSFPLFWTWRAPVRKLRLAQQGCPVYFYRRGALESLLEQAGFGGWDVAKVGKLYCVTAFVRG